MVAKQFCSSFTRYWNIENINNIFIQKARITMPNLDQLENAMPVAPLKLVVMDSAKEIGESVNNYLIEFRKQINNVHKADPAFHGYAEDNYLAKFTNPRFGTGEAKASILHSIR